MQTGRKEKTGGGISAFPPSFDFYSVHSASLWAAAGWLGEGRGNTRALLNIAGLTRSLQGGRKGGIVVEWKESGEEL